MIKRNNKKGFTIVELVIVIAVIAILAAVLIPTFAGVIKKAQESADIQAVRQMNTALAVEDAYKGGLTINDAVATLTEAGLNGEDYIALVSGRYFFYDATENRIVYAEYKNGTYTVLFPEDIDTTGHQLLSLSGDVAKEDYAAPTYDSATATTTVKIANGEQLAQLVSDLKDLESGEVSSIKGFDGLTRAMAHSSGIYSVYGDIVIELTSDIDFKGASFNLNVGEDNGERTSFTLKSSEGNNFTISGIVNQSGFAVSNANAEAVDSEYGGAFLGYCQNADIKFENVTFKDCSFGNEKVKGSAVFVGQSTDSSITFSGTKVENCSVSGLKGVGVYVGHAINEANCAAPQTITFTGTNTVSKVTLESTDATLIGIMNGRRTVNTQSITFNYATAPTVSDITMTAAGKAVADANTRWIITGSNSTTDVISDLSSGTFG